MQKAAEVGFSDNRQFKDLPMAADLLRDILQVKLQQVHQIAMDLLKVQVLQLQVVMGFSGGDGPSTIKRISRKF